MSLSGLLAATGLDPAISTITEAVGTPTLTVSGPGGLQPFAVAAAARAGRLVLAVTANEREGEELVTALRCLLPPDEVAL